MRKQNSLWGNLKMQLDEQYKERVRTDLYCHDCTKNFVASLDFSLDGNHEIHCPWCGHIHYRGIKNGKVTEDRYYSDNGTTPIVVGKRHVWKNAVQPIVTSTASAFIRERWANRYDTQ